MKFITQISQLLLISHNFRSVVRLDVDYESLSFILSKVTKSTATYMCSVHCSKRQWDPAIRFPNDFDA